MLAFNLEILNRNAASQKIEIEGEGDNFVPIITYACRAFADMRALSFNVSGFGQDEWPVDVAADLAIFLSEIPEILPKIDKLSKFSIAFCNQGLERTLFFHPVNTDFQVHCKSWTSWKPVGDERINKESLTSMIVKAADTFVDACDLWFPSMRTNIYFADWIDSVMHDEKKAPPGRQ